jgi:hypothetical protein
MAVQKLSIALDEELAAEARASAARAGTTVSAWVARAARDALVRERGLRAVADWESEHGAITAAERRRADAVLDRIPRARKRA